MCKTDGIFDIDSPDCFFDSIKKSFENYKAEMSKNIELLLYIIMGLNHLREWIAPGYEPKKPPSNPAQRFFQNIYKKDCYITINNLCNRTKHLMPAKEKTSSEHTVNFDDWKDFDSVRNFDNGPASNYFVDSKNIIEIIEEVINLYEVNWFNKKQ